MKLDLHVHTNRFSGCSNIHPHEILKRALDAGLDGIVLTEHGIRWPDEEIQKIFAGANVLVLPGEEAACYSRQGRFQGEFLVFGYPKSLGSAQCVEDLVQRVHQENGVVVAAHPFKRARNGESFYGCGAKAGEYNLDGIETHHPSYDAPARAAAMDLAQKAGLASIGGSDAHSIERIGTVATVFEQNIQTLDDLCREIRARRVRAEAGPT